MELEVRDAFLKPISLNRSASVFRRGTVRRLKKAWLFGKTKSGCLKQIENHKRTSLLLLSQNRPTKKLVNPLITFFNANYSLMLIRVLVPSNMDE